MTIKNAIQFSSGGGTTPSTSGDYKVRFIDFDGTVLKEEWVDSGNAATAPDTPDHDYLTFDEWNRSFSSVTQDMDVGAIYETTDGKTYVFIEVNSLTGLEVVVYIESFSGTTITIDWGDGTPNTTNSYSWDDTDAHTYASAGQYIIKISATGGNYGLGNGDDRGIFYNTRSDVDCLTKLYVGNNVTEINCREAVNLEYVSISNSVTTLMERCFNNCDSLRSLNIPSSVTDFEIYATYYVLSIEKFVLSDTEPTMDYGNSNFYNVSYFTLPEAFNTIVSRFFYNWVSLRSVFIGDVTSIGSYAFYNCSALNEIILTATTPPTLGDNSNVFSGKNNLFKIYVPDASVSAYKAATNWSSFSDYIYSINDRP